ncbi:MAG: 50S ribosomal protein L25 [Patescibacteria group bacterium]|jgi:large subunit ribosomal protein L25
MELKLQASQRVKNEKLDADFVPAVLYGKGIANQTLKIKRVDFDKVFAAAGESNLINLDFGQGNVKVLVKDLQRDVVKGFFSHIDFYQVNMKEKITTEIPLHFKGESKAVKELGGMLMREVQEIEVECLPSDLIDHIDVDISSLVTFADIIKISDLSLPVGFKLMHHHAEDIVAMVVEPKVEEETKAVETASSETPLAGATPGAEPKKEADKK